MNRVIEITSADFDEKVLRSHVTALMGFYSESCGPCRLLAPVLEEVADEVSGSVAVFKVNAIVNIDLAKRLGISGLPTVSVFKEEQEVARLVGLQNRERLLEAVRT